MFFSHCFLERGGGGEREKGRNTDVREKHQLVAFSYVSGKEVEPTSWLCALTGIKLPAFRSTGPRSNRLSYTGQGYCAIFKCCLTFYEKKGKFLFGLKIHWPM